MFIKKRIFWSICGHPDFCNHFFPILGSQLKLVDFLQNCLKKRIFLSICGHPDFCNFGQPARTRRFPINLSIKKRIFARSAVIRTFALPFLQFWAAVIRTFALTFFEFVCSQMCFWAPNTLGAWAGGVFQPTAVGPTFQVLLVS